MQTPTSANSLLLSGQNTRSIYDADALQHWIWHLCTYKPKKENQKLKQRNTRYNLNDLVCFIVQGNYWKEFPSCWQNLKIPAPKFFCDPIPALYLSVCFSFTCQSYIFRLVCYLFHVFSIPAHFSHTKTYKIFKLKAPTAAFPLHIFHIPPPVFQNKCHHFFPLYYLDSSQS